MSDGIVDDFTGRVPAALTLTDRSDSVDRLARIGPDRYML